MVEAGSAPEACTGTLRRFRPHLVVLVDAIDMRAAPGRIAWFDRWSADSVTASTHGLPLSMLADYLRSELGCEVALLGVQPIRLGFGEPVSIPVRRAVKTLVVELLKLRHAMARPTPALGRAPTPAVQLPPDSAHRRAPPVRPELRRELLR